MKQLENVLLVHNYYQIPGGEDTVVTNEKKLLENNGHKVILYSRSNSELKEWTTFRKLVFPLSMVFNIKTYKDIKKIIQTERIDIVHVHNTLAMVSPSVYYAALCCNAPVVQTIHNFRLLCPGATFYRDGHICKDCIKYGLFCAVRHNCYRGSKAATFACVLNMWIHRALKIYQKLNYICLTEFNKDALLKLKQINENQIFIKPNFSDNLDIETIPYKHRKKRFIYAGRIDKSKGIDVLFDAWRQMGAEAPQLLVCGIGPMEDWCKEYIKKNQLNQIYLLGYVPNPRLKMLMADSLALIMPTQLYEGFPMTIVEAYSTGTPVIGSDIGNVGSLIEDGITGWKFKTDSAEDLAKRVKQVSDICTSVQEEFRKKYTSLHNYDLIKSIYEKIVSDS